MTPPQVYLCSPSWTLLPPLSPYHPSGSSQCISPKHPVLCIEPGLATHFIHDIIHVSMPFSQIFSSKGLSSQGYGFSSGHLWMWELDCEESWAMKNWCFWTMVLEKALESPLDCKEIQPVHSEGDQSWVFFGRNDAKAETPVLRPPHAKNWLIGKDSDAGRDWGQEEKGTTEDGMAGWHHRLNGREFEWTLGVGDGQGGLLFCNSWGRRESDMIEWLNWTELGEISKHWIFIPNARNQWSKWKSE